MISVTCRRPFSELGDQQLLEQTKRLAANQRCLEVHILDHLDEIDRRGLALRRGFSSLFDYAVRELRFTDAAAQRRIQAMRLCRRHGWVRASLQSGELSLTSAAQLETTFAGAERAERQSRTAHRNVGQTRQLGLPAAPGEAGEQGERGPRSAPELAPPAGECAGDAAAVNTRVAPVASHAVAQDPGAGHAGAQRPRPELNGNAAPFPASSCDAVAVPGPAAPSSDEGPAPQQLLPPTNLPAPAPVPVPVPVVAPSESLPPASLAPESSGHDPFAELSPGPSSAAPLLHPQRQRELIEQAVGMSTRQVAVLLAAAAPEVVPPRDTLRAVAPDRYTLKVSIDQECEQGLRRLKGLLSHIDPRMSWGDLVARLVREAVARHDPRGGGSGQRRRRSAGSAGASPRPAPNKTRAAGAADAPAQRVHESSRRASKTRRPAGAAAGPVQRVSESSRRAPNRTRAAAAPAAPAQRGGGATPAPQADTAATEKQNPIAMLANAAPPSQSGPAALLDGARADGVPSGAPAAAAAPQSGPAAPLDGARGGGAPSGAPAATAAPKFASDALADGSHAGAAVPGSLATSAPGHLACSPTADRATHQPEQRAHAAVGATSGNAGLAAVATARRRSGVMVGNGHFGVTPPLTADRARALAAGTQPEQRAGPRRMASLRAKLRRAGLAGRHFGGGAGTRRVPRRRTERRISRGSGAHDPRFCPQLPPIPATAPHTSGCSAPRLATRRRTLLLSRSAHRAPLHLFPSAADRPPAAGRPGRWPGAVQPQSAVRSSPQNAPRPRVGCAAGATDVAPPPRCCRAARLHWPTACRWPAGTHCTWWRSWTGRTGGFAAPRAERASSLPPHQNLAGRCRRAHARRCRGLTSTNSCRFRRSHP